MKSTSMKTSKDGAGSMAHVIWMGTMMDTYTTASATSTSNSFLPRFSGCSTCVHALEGKVRTREARERKRASLAYPYQSIDTRRLPGLPRTWFGSKTSRACPKW